MKKAMSIFVFACVLCSLVMGASATNPSSVPSAGEESGSISQFDYIIVDKTGTIVESGSVNYATRANYSPVSIPNGYYALFKTGAYGLQAQPNTKMRFDFSLDKASECTISWYEGDGLGNSKSVWSQYHSLKIVGASIPYTSNSSGVKYYYTGIFNNSSNVFTVTQASINW